MQSFTIDSVAAALDAALKEAIRADVDERLRHSHSDWPLYIFHELVDQITETTMKSRANTGTPVVDPRF